MGHPYKDSTLMFSKLIKKYENSSVPCTITSFKLPCGYVYKSMREFDDIEFHDFMFIYARNERDLDHLLQHISESCPIPELPGCSEIEQVDRDGTLVLVLPINVHPQLLLAEINRKRMN